jgi:hypothetical protein
VNNSNGSERLKRINEFLESIEISFSHSPDGRSVTAYTNKEPLFCFERPSVDELKPVLAHAFVSYLVNFYDAAKVEVDIESTSVPEEVRTVPPVQRLTPFRRGRPILRALPRRELEPA